MSFGRDSSATIAWRRLDSEIIAHGKTRAELDRLRAALQHIADDGAVSPASYARHVLDEDRLTRHARARSILASTRSGRLCCVVLLLDVRSCITFSA